MPRARTEHTGHILPRLVSVPDLFPIYMLIDILYTICPIYTTDVHIM